MALSNIKPTKYNLILTGVKDEIFMQRGTVLMGRNGLKRPQVTDKTLSHNVVHLGLSRILTHNISGERHRLHR
jgi:hypothetical protein